MLPGILLVADKLGMRFLRESGGEMIFRCPICGEQKGHLYIDARNNVWHCAKCGAGGGVCALVEQVLGVSHRDALQSIRKMDWSILPEPVRFFRGKTASGGSRLAPDGVRDRTYRTMLGLLRLRQKDRYSLLKRGFSRNAVETLGFRSTPGPGKYNEDIPASLIRAGCELSGVPGFFRKDRKWYMYCPLSGFFVPYLKDGIMEGLQIRNGDPFADRKYAWFSSSGFPEGTRAKSWIHEISFPANPRSVCLTEGALKADAASYLTYRLTGRKIGFLALPGVSSGGKLFRDELNKLKMAGVQEIIEAFDMDKQGNLSVPVNNEVQKACRKVRNLILSSGFFCRPAVWESGKGIDDFLLQKMQRMKRVS